jgi:hypothetical protein
MQNMPFNTTLTPALTTTLTLSIERAVQTPQPGGYSLLSLTLNTPITLSSAQQFGAFYWPADDFLNTDVIADVITDVNANLDQPAMYLFAVTPLTLQLLSPTALNEAALAQRHNRPITLSITAHRAINLSQADNDAPHPLLILASDTRIANALYLAKQRQTVAAKTLVLLGARQVFPFIVKPARFMMPTMPAEAIGACPLLEDWGIANRLASQAGQMGCYEGRLSDLLSEWLTTSNATATEVGHGLSPAWQVVHFVDVQAQSELDALCCRHGLSAV